MKKSAIIMTAVALSMFCGGCDILIAIWYGGCPPPPGGFRRPVPATPGPSEMVFVYGGTFTMGCTAEQSGLCDGCEEPARETAVRGFCIAQTEVTQGLWKSVMGALPARYGDTASAELELGDDYPVYYVSWDAAQEFIRNLTEKTGLKYRLPTEAEWEYAARGGGKSKRYRYSGGDTIADVAWYQYDSCNGNAHGDDFKCYGGNSGGKPHPVAAKKPNELRLYDMSGNVWEWTGTTGEDSLRIYRGGGFDGGACLARVSNRFDNSPESRPFALGLRLARRCSDAVDTAEPVDLKVIAKPLDMVLVQGKNGLPDFYIGRFEVTQGLWKAVMGSNPSVFDGRDDMPVSYVSWDDAVDFIRKLNSKTEGNYRLPNDAEWVYAARGGKMGKGYRYSGGNNLEGVAWYAGNSDFPHPVGGKKPNELGLYDMTGNVYEWTGDKKRGVDPIFRGGSYATYAKYCRISERNSTFTSHKESLFGFRLAMSVKDTPAAAASEAARPANKPVDINGIDMVFVRGGTFQMGCTEEQGGCYNNTKPVHGVTLNSFFIGRYEVTQGLWKAVMDKDLSWIDTAGGLTPEAVRLLKAIYGSNPSEFTGNDDRPVENVRYGDAQAFLRELNAKTGRNYRLPTEAEWEYAARGGIKSGRHEYAGSNDIDDVAWYGKNSGGMTHPVGMKRPNELGLYDMSGNVEEWLSGWTGGYPSEHQTNPQGSNDSARSDVRGCSWFSSLDYYCDISAREWGSHEYTHSRLGLRLAHDAGEESQK